MTREWQEFRMAAAFLTVFPAARGLETTPARLGRSLGFFPAVGLVIGLFLVIINWALAAFLPRAVLDCLLILSLVAATGALHLDGMAGLFSGLAQSKSREGTRPGSKDAPSGSTGVIALVLILLLKYLSLYNIPLEIKSAALLFMPCAGRWIQVVLASFCRYLRSGGDKRGAFVDHAGEREFLIGTTTLLLASLVLFGLSGIFLLFLIGLIAMVLLRFFEARFGGVTGEALGASTEVIEVLTLLLILAVM